MNNIQEFNAKDIDVIKLFSDIGDAYYYVPIFQRKYDWKANVHVKQLIDDLKHFYNEHKDDLDDATYYLGNIIVKPIKTGITEKTDKYILIDGQQRMTTLLLFLKHLRDSLILLKEDMSTENFDLYYKEINSFIFTFRGGEKQRLLKINNPQMDKVMANIFSEDKKWITPEDKQTNYYKNYLMIENETNITSLEDWNKWLVIFKKIKLVRILLGKKDNEIEIFESINSKGLNLNLLNLVKNYLFLWAEKHKLPEDSKNQINNLIDNEILPILSKNGNITTKAINKFFSAILTSLTGKYQKLDKDYLYEEFKKHYSSKMSEESSFLDLVDKLSKYSIWYEKYSSFAEKFESNEIEKEESYQISRGFLSSSKFDLYLPLFFVLESTKERNMISDEEVHKIFELLDLHNISVSFMESINKDNKFFLPYIQELNENPELNISYDNLKDYLIKKGRVLNKSGLQPKNELENNIINLPIYSKDGRVARYILYRIENLLSSKAEEFIKFSNWTLEHIVPQSISKNSLWEKQIDSQLKIENEHKLGNLVLATLNINASLKNYDYEKKIKIFKESKLKLIDELLNNYPDQFVVNHDNNSITNRGKQLLAYIKKIWDFDVLDKTRVEENNKKEEMLINSYLEKITKKDTIKIKDALAMTLFLSDEAPLKTSILSERLKEFVYRNNANFKFNFNVEKVAPNYIGERLQRNFIEYEDSERFEGNLFFRNEDGEWDLSKEHHKLMKNI